MPVKGTVLGNMLADTPLAKIDDIEFVRTVAVARITMPMSMVRLSAGRESMSEATQALCFMAGANSIFTGDKLLTAPNAGDDTDAALFAKLGLTALQQEEPMRARLQGGRAGGIDHPVDRTADWQAADGMPDCADPQDARRDEHLRASVMG